MLRGQAEKDACKELLRRRRQKMAEEDCMQEGRVITHNKFSSKEIRQPVNTSHFTCVPKTLSCLCAWHLWQHLQKRRSFQLIQSWSDIFRCYTEQWLILVTAPASVVFPIVFKEVPGTGRGLPGGSVVKNLPVMREKQVQSLGWEDPLEEEMATHSSIVAWEIPWTEEAHGVAKSGTQLSAWAWACTRNRKLILDRFQILSSWFVISSILTEKWERYSPICKPAEQEIMRHGSHPDSSCLHSLAGRSLPWIRR